MGVAAVENVVQQASSVEFRLNDSTGRIQARYFAPDTDSQIVGLAPGRYVSIAGQLRISPTTHISVTNAHVVLSPDEISYHMIECVHAAMCLRRGPVEVAAPPPKSVVPPPQNEPTTQAPVEAPAASPEPQAMSGDALRKEALEILRKEAETGGPEGVSVTVIFERLRPAKEADVRAVLQGLADDGEIFNTLDFDHFAMI